MAAAARQQQSRRKVCLFTLCEIPSKNKNKLVEDVYVFDLDRSPWLLDADNLTPVAPVLRFCVDNPVARFVINSKLYLFDGHDMTKKSIRKSVHFIDLPEPCSSTASKNSTGKSDLPKPSSSIASEPVLVPVQRMKLCSPMCGQKYFPHTIPTWDCRKIVVFSSVIEHPRQEGFVDVEVYDHVNGTSLELPPLPRPNVLDLLNKREFRLKAYYFINGTTLVLHTDLPNHVVFTIDLNPNQISYEWEVIRGDIPRPVIRDGFVVSDTLLVSRSGLYDMSREYGCSEFPHDPIVEEELSRMGWLPAVIDNCPDREPEICILYVDFEPDFSKEYPRVYVEVHQINPTTIFHESGSIIISGGRGRGRGGQVGTRLELRPTRSKTYGFELRMPYSSCSAHVVYPVRASAG